MGAAVWQGGVPSLTLVRRCDAAATLFRAGGHDTVIPSGGIGTHSPAEAVVMRDLLVARGVPESAIWLEDRATTTMETAQLVAGMIGPDACVTVVSDGYHLARCTLAFRGAGHRVRLHSTRHARPAVHRRTAAKMWMRETVALPYYLWRLFRRR